MRPLLFLLLVLLGTGGAAVRAQTAVGTDTLPVVRVAALKYGTAAWELALISERGLDRANGFRLEVLARVSPNASLVALQGGAADFTVGDWLWVAKQRGAGRDYRYYPYSTALGELLVSEGSAARDLRDLEGARVGVAGGAEDKSWLLFQVHAQREGLDLATFTEPRYAAPPLLSGLAQTGELEAVLTYWHYAARLKAEGFRSLLTLPEVLTGLGIDASVPMLGWVFPGSWADQNPALVEAFLHASYTAKELLLTQDDVWTVVYPLMNVSSDGEFAQLKFGYRAGVPRGFGEAERRGIQDVARIVDRALRSRGTEGADAADLSAAFWERRTVSSP